MLIVFAMIHITVNSFTFNNITTNHTISMKFATMYIHNSNAVFQWNNYTGTTSVNYGVFFCCITPASGYQLIAYWSTVHLLHTSPYVFSNVNASHSNRTFWCEKYSITATSGKWKYLPTA